MEHNSSFSMYAGWDVDVPIRPFLLRPFPFRPVSNRPLPIRPDGNINCHFALNRKSSHIEEHLIIIRHFWNRCYKVKGKIDDFGSGVSQQPGFYLHAASKVLENPHLRRFDPEWRLHHHYHRDEWSQLIISEITQYVLCDNYSELTIASHSHKTSNKKRGELILPAGMIWLDYRFTAKFMWCMAEERARWDGKGRIGTSPCTERTG